VIGGIGSSLAAAQKRCHCIVRRTVISSLLDAMSNATTSLLNSRAMAEVTADLEMMYQRGAKSEVAGNAYGRSICMLSEFERGKHMNSANNHLGALATHERIATSLNQSARLQWKFDKRQVQCRLQFPMVWRNKTFLNRSQRRHRPVQRTVERSTVEDTMEPNGEKPIVGQAPQATIGP
jgi:hypothetical protein